MTGDAGPPANGRRRRWPRVIQALWLALILGFVAVALATQWRTLADYDWQPAYPYLIVALLAALLRRFWGGVHWAILLPTISRTPVRRHFAKNLGIYFLTNLATYLPGSLWYIPWRVKVYREQGISGTHTAVSSAVESVMLVISHGLVGLPILLQVLSSEKVLDLRWFLTILLAGMLAVQPPVLRLLFRLLKRVLGRRIEEPHFELRHILASLGWMVVKAFIAGVSLFFLLKSLSPELGADAYLFVTGALALAWTAGFITPFAPAGLGVREGLLVWLLSYQVPLPVATVAAVTTRLIFLVEDVGWVGIALGFARWRRGRTPTACVTAKRKYAMPIDDKRPAPVSPDVYDPEWVEEMGGWGSNEAFLESGGEAVRPRLAYALELGGVRAGMSILDLGCGRGEVLICCARAGARRVLGVDYAPVSVAKARRNINAMGMDVNHRESPLALLLSDAKKIPLADRSIDRVFMLDIVEHLHEWELQEVWAEVRRILKDEGLLVIHTLPNRWAIDYGYRLARLVVRGLPRAAADKRDIFHINEQSVPSLARSLEKSGLKSRVWIKSLMLRNADYLHDQGLEGEMTQDRIYQRLRRPWWRMAFRLAMWLPTRLVLATDVFALAWKSSSPPAVIRNLPPNFSERLVCLLADRGQRHGSVAD